MIVTEGLTKQHRRAISALTDVSLSVRQGEVFGLLGLQRVGENDHDPVPARVSQTNLRFGDRGRASLLVRQPRGSPPGQLPSRRAPDVWCGLSGLKMLRFLSDLRGGEPLDRAVALAEQVMKLDLRRKVRTYSTGMKQKLALSASVCGSGGDPDPRRGSTSALDPSARAEVLELVRQARDVQKQTVVFSGHVLSEVEEVSDRVAIMSQGRLVHLEDMHERPFAPDGPPPVRRGVPPSFPDDLELTVRERNGSTCLLEHRGRIGALLNWLSRSPIEDVAIGTDDLRSSTSNTTTSSLPPWRSRRDDTILGLDAGIRTESRWLLGAHRHGALRLELADGRDHVVDRGPRTEIDGGRGASCEPSPFERSRARWPIWPRWRSRWPGGTIPSSSSTSCSGRSPEARPPSPWRLSAGRST